MKLAILSDFHFGYPRFYEDSFTQASEAMRIACERADALLIPGDIFDSRTPALDVIERSINVFSIPKEKDWRARITGREGYAPVIVIHGTHERRSRDFTNPVHVLEAAGLAIDAHKEPVVIELDGERVAVHGLSGVPEYLAKAAIEKRGYKPLKGAFNIFMFHQSLRELLPDEEAMGIEDLPEVFDLYVCGHMHKNIERQVGKTKLLIPGSTVLTQMKKDEEASKGLYLYDTRAAKASFVPINTRPFFYRELMLRGASLAEARRACEDELKRLLDGSEGQKPIVRLKLKGTLAKGLSSQNLVIDLEELLESKAFVTIVKELEDMEGEKMALIRDIREKKISVKELGLRMLVKRLSEKGMKTENVEELFDTLTDPKGADKAFERLRALPD